MPKSCENCGTWQPDGAKFCNDCGCAFPSPFPDPSTSPAGPATMDPPDLVSQAPPVRPEEGRFQSRLLWVPFGAIVIFAIALAPWSTISLTKPDPGMSRVFPTATRLTAAVISTATPVPTATRMPTPTATGTPTPEQLWVALDAAWADNNWTLVLDVLGQLTRLDPEKDEYRSKLYDAHVNYGQALLAGGNTDAAALEFQRAIDLDPERQEAKDLAGSLAPAPATAVRSPTAPPAGPPPAPKPKPSR
jgi:hypothetical protein